MLRITQTRAVARRATAPLPNTALRGLFANVLGEVLAKPAEPLGLGRFFCGVLRCRGTRCRDSAQRRAYPVAARQGRRGESGRSGGGRTRATPQAGRGGGGEKNEAQKSKPG